MSSPYSESDKVLRLEVYLRQGMDIDNINPVEGTFVDVVIKSNEHLSVIDETIRKSVNLTEQINLIYYKRNESLRLEIDKSFNELNIRNGDHLEVFYDNLSTSKPEKDNHEEVYLHDELDREDNILELLCTTRIFEVDGIPLKRVRILVNKYDYIKFLVDDVSQLWNKTGLKFKYGRIILSGEKSYQDYDIQNYSEIIVTGGRG